jgi:hypothetical protein
LSHHPNPISFLLEIALRLVPRYATSATASCSLPSEPMLSDCCKGLSVQRRMEDATALLFGAAITAGLPYSNTILASYQSGSRNRFLSALAQTRYISVGTEELVPSVVYPGNLSVFDEIVGRCICRQGRIGNGFVVRSRISRCWAAGALPDRFRFHLLRLSGCIVQERQVKNLIRIVLQAPAWKSALAKLLFVSVQSQAQYISTDLPVPCSKTRNLHQESQGSQVGY